MKKMMFVIASVLLFSCNKKVKEIASGDLPFFVFDQVEYYHIDLSKTALDSIVFLHDKSDKDLALLQIVKGKIPVSSIDTLFIPNMEVLHFHKKELDTTDFKKLNELFSKREAKKQESTTNCNSYYKDLLIFRNKTKFIGVAKLDLECGKSLITGARYNTEAFGASGEFTELKQLISKFSEQ